MKKLIISLIFCIGASFLLCSCNQTVDTELENLLNSLETSYLPGQEPTPNAPPEPFIDTLTGEISEINETVFAIKTADKKRYTVETAGASFYGAEPQVGLTAVVTYVNYGGKIKSITATSVLVEDVNNYTESSEATDESSENTEITEDSAETSEITEEISETTSE